MDNRVVSTLVVVPVLLPVTAVAYGELNFTTALEGEVALEPVAFFISTRTHIAGLHIFKSLALIAGAADEYVLVVVIVPHPDVGCDLVEIVPVDAVFQADFGSLHLQLKVVLLKQRVFESVNALDIACRLRGSCLWARLDVIDDPVTLRDRLLIICSGGCLLCCAGLAIRWQ